MNKHNQCECGNVKDNRAERCALCAGKSYTIDGQDRVTQELATEIRKALPECSSFLQVASRVGISRYIVTSYIKKEKLDISHFWGKRGRFTDPSRVLCKDSKATRALVKKTVIRLGLLPERCECGLTNEWNGRPLVLELDHKDGNRHNNDVENLRFLCPNCHSQTPTHRGKNYHQYETRSDAGIKA